MMSDFDERSGVVSVATPWGRWWQTIEEVFIEILLDSEVSSKCIKCDIQSRRLKITVNAKCILEGALSESIHADEAIWTLEDRKTINVCLPKSLKTSEHCWKSLLVNQYEADAWTFDQMEKKMTLNRFQLENPGFDFSGADISGNYHVGGPNLPS